MGSFLGFGVQDGSCSDFGSKVKIQRIFAVIKIAIVGERDFQGLGLGLRMLSEILNFQYRLTGLVRE